MRASLAALVSLISHLAKDPERALFRGEAGSIRLQRYIAIHPNFLHSLVSKLALSERQVVLSTMTLINLSVRDILGEVSDDRSLSQDEFKAMESWPQLMRILQTTGIVQRVFELMLEPPATRGNELTRQLMQFQLLTMQMIHRWQKREIDVKNRNHHREAIQSFYDMAHRQISAVQDTKSMPDTEVWRKMGVRFPEDPVLDFQKAGWLGVVDLASTIEHSLAPFTQVLHRQWALPFEDRQCPIVQASVIVSRSLCDIFGITDYDHALRSKQMISDADFGGRLEPLLLRWSSLHAGGLLAFVKVWADSKSRMPLDHDISESARLHDFNRVADLIRVLIMYARTELDRDPTIDIKAFMASVSYEKLREIQMEYIDKERSRLLSFDPAEMIILKRHIGLEVLDYVIEQRINCLFQGAWFVNTEPVDSVLPNVRRSISGLSEKDDRASISTDTSGSRSGTQAETGRSSYRFIKLSHDRQQLRWGDYKTKPSGKDAHPQDQIANVIDLSDVTRITVSDSVKTLFQSMNEILGIPPLRRDVNEKQSYTSSSPDTDKSLPPTPQPQSPPPQAKGTMGNLIGALSSRNFAYKISLYGRKAQSSSSKETLLLQFSPQSLDIVAEWYDGLNIALNRNGFSSVSSPSMSFFSDTRRPEPYISKSSISRETLENAIAEQRKTPKASLKTESNYSEERRMQNDLSGRLNMTQESVKYIETITEMVMKVRALDINKLLSHNVQSDAKFQDCMRATA